MMRFNFRRLLLGLLIGAAALSAAAQSAPSAPAPLTTAELFSRPSMFVRPRLSPDRKSMAFFTMANNRRQVAVWDLQTDKISRLTNFTKQNALGLRWVNNERLTITLDYEGNESFGIYAINKDGSNMRVLAEPPIIQGLQGANVAKFVVVERSWPGSDRELIVSANERSGRVPDLYRMDAYTGRKTLLTVDRPAEVRQWVLDNNAVPRVATSWDKGVRQYITWYRSDERSPWKEALRRNPGERGIEPFAFMPDNKRMYALSDVDRDTVAIYEYDIETKTLGKLLFEAPDGYDMGTEEPSVEPRGSTSRRAGLVMSPDDTRILGFFYEGAKPTVLWVDEKMQQHQRGIDAALPDRYNSIGVAKDDQRWLVTSRSDRHPGSYYWYDPGKRTLEHIADVAPHIDEKQMARMQPIEYKARDGLRIRGYLTLPPGREAKNLPTIIHPHGGPWARDTWGFDPDVQFLARLGYAVLQMDFRISQGYGSKHFTAGFKQIGLSMQDDKTDGLNWLVTQGIADPKRVCILGGSYGGYAALWGVTKDPDLYRCAVNLVGVADWEIIMRGLWYSGREIYGPDEIGKWVGSIDNAEDRERFDRTSPVKNAARVKAPILHGYGFNDPRVPIDHHKSIEAALRSAGKVQESVVYDNEGHGWRNPENRLDWYKRLEAFLRKHNPPN